MEILLMAHIRNVDDYRGGGVIVGDDELVVFESVGQRLMDPVGFSVVGGQGNPIGVVVGHVNHHGKVVERC